MNVPDVTPELPGRTWRAVLTMLRFMPQAGLSRGLGQLADVRLPPRLRAPVLGAVANALGIDLGEAEHPPEAYASINELFVRRLRPGARTVDPDPATAVSPVDGVVGQFGRVRDGRLIQAKGREYTAADLLADATEASRYSAGSFLTIYLSPRHYHRIHAPVAGAVTSARYVPGGLWPVNEPAVKHIPNLFPRNERLIGYIDGEFGHTALVAVGAYNVGRISAVFDPAWAAPGWASNQRGGREVQRRYDPPWSIAKGAELMAFHLGSTVVLLFDDALRLERTLTPGAEVRLGSAVARRV